MDFLYRIVAAFTSIIVFFSSAFAGNSPKKTDYKQCKNVIFMIGDGMGFNSIEMAEQVLGRNLDAFDGFELHGESKTASATWAFTDSAAGGTALATGVRVSIETVGVYPDDIDAKKSHPMNLCELAVSQKKSAGIVTTAKTWDATPADFSAHVSYRQNYEAIHRQQSQSSLTLLWGQSDSKLDLDVTRSCGFDIITNEKEMNAADSGSRTFGQFRGDFWIDDGEKGQPTLAEMTSKAIDILDDDTDGFFLMVEGAHIDKCSEDKDAGNMAKAMSGFNNAVQTALDYAKSHGDTMVVVTADHETGGIKKTSGEYRYTTSLHTSANVPVYVYGCDNFIGNGEKIENREVGRRTACVMGETKFPIEVKN